MVESLYATETTTTNRALTPTSVATAMTQFDRQIALAPNLGDLGLAISLPADRKDGGAIRYTTLPETVRNWAEDPYGRRTLDFVRSVYGIPYENFEDVMHAAGLSEFLQAKNEGRYVGMVASQILKPTYYFLSNALALGHLARQGVPTAFMVGEYSSDTFYAGNGDKGQAFGRVEFPVEIKTKEDKVKKENGEEKVRVRQVVRSVSLELKPYGIRNDDGTVTRIRTIDEANGFRCDQVLVKITDARGSSGQSFSHTVDERKSAETGQVIKTIRTHHEATLGLTLKGIPKETTYEGKQEVDLPEQESTMSIADFYRVLWMETISRLRESGELPSEEEMPMFFVDAKKMYSVLAQEANPPQMILDMLGLTSEMTILTDVLKLEPQEARYIASRPTLFSEYLRGRNLRRLNNGFLARLDNGVLDPGSYYVVQNIWPDGYLECSSCGGETFVGKITRGQAVQQQFGIPEKEVRLPDHEIPELEGYVVHPTGKFSSDTKVFDGDIPRIRGKIEKLIKAKKSLPANAREERQVFVEEIDTLKAEVERKEQTVHDDFYDRVHSFEGRRYNDAGLIIPPTVAATYKELLQGVSETIEDPQVQATILEVTNGNRTILMDIINES